MTSSCDISKTVFGEDLVEAVHAEARGPAIAIARQVGELDDVVRQDGVDIVTL